MCFDANKAWPAPPALFPRVSKPFPVRRPHTLSPTWPPNACIIQPGYCQAAVRYSVLQRTLTLATRVPGMLSCVPRA